MARNLVNFATRVTVKRTLKADSKNSNNKKEFKYSLVDINRAEFKKTAQEKEALKLAKMHFKHGINSNN
jgi:hypothetical protein